MALALILALERGDAGVRVRFDIGKNRFLRWQSGGEPQQTRSGLPGLSEVKERSGLIGPLPPESRGRGECLIPESAFSQDQRWLQLLSYRERDGSGPAMSAVLEVEKGTLTTGVGSGDELPPPAGFSVSQGRASQKESLMQKEGIKKQTGREHAMTAVSVAHAIQVDNAPFALRERRYSEPLFLEAIVGALPALLPMLAPAVRAIVGPAAVVGGGSAGVGGSTGAVAGAVPAVGGGGASGAAAGGSGTQQVVSQIGALAEQVLRAVGPIAERLLTPENLRQITGLIQAANAAPVRAAAQSWARSSAMNRPRYSQAQVAPILAAMPALMPLLQNVLSPQTIQGILDAPQRMTGQVINGITEFAKLGLQADQQLNEHLRALNPGVDDPALHQLLAGMSLGLAARRGRNYKRVAGVTLTLDDIPLQVVMGREIALYQHGVALQFPLTLQTPQNLREAELLIEIKQADNLRVVFETAEPLGDVSSGPLPWIPRIDEKVCSSLLPQKDYLVVLTLLWRNSKGQLRGSPLQHGFALMDEYRFDRVEESGELIPLTDREAYRDYWHQILEVPFTRETRRLDIQTRYYLTLNPERTRNARLDSDVRSSEEGPRQQTQVRSGYEYSPFALNHLMTRLAPGEQVLPDAALRALGSDDFIERFSQSARHTGQIRGRPGETASLWVFPEFKLQTLVMVRADSVDENGCIGALEEERLRFPMPAMLHFVGVKQL